MQNVLIYAGSGVDSSCLINTELLFQNLGYNVKRIKPSNIIIDNWEKTADILVIPGGEDEYYQKDLGEIGCEKIKDFVKNGGKYIGICAGAYFGAKNVEFAKGTDMEVIGKRSLGFFNGTAIGPILKPYSYEDESGACAAKIVLSDSKELYIYYNGGCAFSPEPTEDNVEVIGRYAEKENLPAILRCKIEKGEAILSGVHFEQFSSENPEIQEKLDITKNELKNFIKQLL